MAVRFTCPYCGWTTDVADRYLGRSGECAACGKSIKIPGGSSAEEAATPSSDVQKNRPSSSLLLAGLLALVLLAGVIFFGGMAYVALKPSAVPLLNRNADAAKCAANFKGIGAALSGYVTDKGHFPPAYSTDENGMPLHSWRVLILPYMGYGALYEQLKLDEPWNSEHNARFFNQTPAEYRCPADLQAPVDETNYFVIQGPGGFVFNAHETIVPAEILDGVAQTLLVVEATNMGVLWMQPTDISAQELAWGAGAGLRGIGSEHFDGRFFLLTADGQVSALDTGTTPSELQALATIAGAEAVYPVLLPP